MRLDEENALAAGQGEGVCNFAMADVFDREHPLPGLLAFWLLGNKAKPFGCLLRRQPCFQSAMADGVGVGGVSLRHNGRLRPLC